jgi:hypothetical protein
MTDLAGIELFRCDRHNATMSTAACGRQWLKANTATDRHGKPVEPPAWESLHRCLRCPIGAERNGKTVSAVADMAADLRSICPRCVRRSDRMVNVHGDSGRPLCVSCCNRHYEVEKGRNAKGQKPQKLKLRTVRLQVIEGDQVRTVTMDRVTSAAEVVMTLARQAKGPMQFSYAPMLPPGVPLNPQFTGEDLPEWLDEEEAPPPADAGIVSRLACDEVFPDVAPAPIQLYASLSVRSEIAAELSSPPGRHLRHGDGYQQPIGGCFTARRSLIRRSSYGGRRPRG